MTHFLYRCLILLHPAQFRRRFGAEMLCIFDEAGANSRMPLLVDGLISAMRQWVLRSDAWKWAAAAGGALIQMTLAVFGCLETARRMIVTNLVPQSVTRGGAAGDTRAAGMLILLVAGVVTAIMMGGMLLAVCIGRYCLGFGRTAARRQV